MYFGAITDNPLCRILTNVRVRSEIFFFCFIYIQFSYQCSVGKYAFTDFCIKAIGDSVNLRELLGIVKPSQYRPVPEQAAWPQKNPHPGLFLKKVQTHST